MTAAGLSTRQIAKALDLSTQYVNRIKVTLRNEEEPEEATA